MKSLWAASRPARPVYAAQVSESLFDKATTSIGLAQSGILESGAQSAISPATMWQELKKIGTTRLSALPDVPAFAELGSPENNANYWWESFPPACRSLSSSG